MINEARSRTAVWCSCIWRSFIITLSLVALAAMAWLITPNLRIGSRAVAAEVDAVGARAPLGFADIVARVKPAVVGIRVRVEEATSSDEAEQKKSSPLIPRSIVSSAILVSRFRKAPLPSRELL